MRPASGVPQSGKGLGGDRYATPDGNGSGERAERYGGGRDYRLEIPSWAFWVLCDKNSV